jgi:hypothetical protein
MEDIPVEAVIATAPGDSEYFSLSDLMISWSRRDFPVPKPKNDN